MSNLPDPKSFKQLREAVDKVPPQSGPRAAKALADLKAAVTLMERENKA